MKSKAQKKQEMDQGALLVKDAQSLVFVDFSKTPVAKISELKNKVRNAGGTYRVIKKRLLKQVFADKQIAVDPKQFGGQLATVFSPHDISDVAGVVYTFAKKAEAAQHAFSLLGGYDISSARFFAQDEIKRIGQLPPREILLAQLLGMLQAPVKSLVYTLDQVAKKK